MADKEIKSIPAFSWLDIGLRVLAMVFAAGGILLLWLDLLTEKGAIAILGVAVLALALERIKDY